MITVITGKDEDCEQWQSFVYKHTSTHHSFDWGWRQVISRTFNHQAHYLLALDKNHAESPSRVRGVLPLFEVKSPLFGHSLVSMPYLNAGGILADDKNAFEALLHSAQALTDNLGASYLELRCPGQYPSEWCALPSRQHKVSMLLALKSDPEELFQSFPAKLRSQIRRPTKAGLYTKSFRTGDDEQLALSHFYQVFSRNMRDLGTPVYPRQLFLNVLSGFRDRWRINLVYKEDEPVAAGLTIGKDSAVEIPWASSLKEFNNMSPNMLLYWETLRQCCLDGYGVFDFGRSTRDSGTYKFKAQWGAQPLELTWYYHAKPGRIPDVNPHSKKYAFLVDCWKRLPLSLANLMGPIITKRIP